MLYCINSPASKKHCYRCELQKFKRCLFFLGLFSLYGYLVFLRAIWGNEKLQKRSIFLMSLCVSDLCMIGGHMIGAVLASFLPDWPFGQFGCQVSYAILFTNSLYQNFLIVYSHCRTLLYCSRGFGILLFHQVKNKKSSGEVAEL